MDRDQRLLSLESGTFGPAPGLPSPPRAAGTQRTCGLTKWTTSPKLQPWQLEPLEGIRMESNRPLSRVGKSPPQTKVERHPPQAKAERHPPQAKAGRHPPQAKAERHPLPVRAVNRPPQAEVGSKLPQGAWLTHPWSRQEWATAHGTIGTRGPSGGLKGVQLSPKGLPTQSGLHR